MTVCLNTTCKRLVLSELNVLSRIINNIEMPVTAVSVQLTTAMTLKHSRQLHTVESRYSTVGKLTKKHNPDWNRTVSEAENVVGYPSSLLNLSSLYSDEIANIGHHIKKLEGSNHPLLKTAKSLLNDERNNMQDWGIIVLLISEAAGHLNVDKMKENKTAGVLHSQRTLAKVIEMIRTSHLIHNSLFNIYPGLDLEPSVLKDMAYGNKIALLSGDYVLAAANMDLATLGNHDLMHLMSCAIRDQAEAEFHGRRDKQNMPLPSVEGATDPLEDWTTRNVLSSGSLLGKGCQGTLLLAGQSDQHQQQAHEFGMNLALAWQACLELEPFLPGTKYIPGTMFNLTSAPVMFHLEQDPGLFTEIDKGKDSVSNVDFATVSEIVSKGPGVASTKRLQKKHSQKAMEMLEVFEESDARTALFNIIDAMGSFEQPSKS